MTTPNELTLVERPLIEFLESLGYTEIPPEDHPRYRAKNNEALFGPLVIQALMKLNAIDEPTARSIYSQLASVNDNERWLKLLRNDHSKLLPGETQHQTIKLVDYDNPTNNLLHVTSQLRVEGARNCIPDIVVYLNGIPLVVIEAKSPLSSQTVADAIHQIQQYEEDVPRLFASNLFNIVTNNLELRYGSTGAPQEYWGHWRDPWPRTRESFGNAAEAGCWALLEPSRLLDLLAHFTVFETREGKTIKKVCRYQQFRAVNKMVERVVNSEHRAGLVWHTQGSGKSLTMVFAALKLKKHMGIHHERLGNPNLMVITDRVDLHDQITKTFHAVGIRNVRSVEGIDRPKNPDGTPKMAKKNEKEKHYLREELVPGAVGKVVLSTIFKFNWEDPRLTTGTKRERMEALRDLEVAGSENWILMIDECHRTQEKDLGAYLHAILPKAVRFGFTGTPVKKNDHDTFGNFGAPGERYLDKYGIEDAVRDGATVPIFYQARKAEWHLHDRALDSLFDQWFASESEETRTELKNRGIPKTDLARFEPRIEAIAEDIWAHYQEWVKPDGFKAQVVAIDRLSCVAYKKSLDTVIARTFRLRDKLPAAEALAKAQAMTACVYSPGQHDRSKYPELAAHQLDEAETKSTIASFNKKGEDPVFLIVCSKLLTGFDAPIEGVMYLDNPLTDHTLLQAIARTNRRYGQSKQKGMIVDYIGVTDKLKDALSAYNSDDVAGALQDYDALADALAVAHREVMDLIRGVPRSGDINESIKAALTHIGTLDRWYIFRSKADAFIKAYDALTPEPRVLPYKADLKFINAVVTLGRVDIEKEEPKDWRKYSEKIREMLRQSLEVTGLTTLTKLRSLHDDAFWDDFSEPKDLKTAAVRKLTELKKVTREKTAENPARYEKFSDRIKELIEQFDKGLIDAQQTLDFAHQTAKDMVEAGKEHENTGLSARAYDVALLLEKFRPPPEPVAADGAGKGGPSEGLTALEEAAIAIDALYASDETAPYHWQERTYLKKELRQQVRRLLAPLKFEGWKDEIPKAVERYAVQHYAKP